MIRPIKWIQEATAGWRPGWVERLFMAGEKPVVKETEEGFARDLCRRLPGLRENAAEHIAHLVYDGTLARQTVERVLAGVQRLEAKGLLRTSPVSCFVHRMKTIIGLREFQRRQREETERGNP